MAPPLIAALPTKVALLIVDVVASLSRAPPSFRALLALKTQPLIKGEDERLAIAPPLIAALPAKTVLIKVGFAPSLNTAPPSFAALLLVNVQLLNRGCARLS